LLLSDRGQFREGRSDTRPYVRPHNHRHDGIHRRYYARRIHRAAQRPIKPASWDLGLQYNHAMLGDGAITTDVYYGVRASSLADRFSRERERDRAALPSGPDTGIPGPDRSPGQPSGCRAYRRSPLGRRLWRLPLVRQFKAGVEAVQIFDTWAGILPDTRMGSGSA
jgi:hypothetical protein